MHPVRASAAARPSPCRERGLQFYDLCRSEDKLRMVGSRKRERKNQGS